MMKEGVSWSEEEASEGGGGRLRVRKSWREHRRKKNSTLPDFGSKLRERCVSTENRFKSVYGDSVDTRLSMGKH